MTAKLADGGKLADPKWRTERARKAALARHTLSAQISAIERRADELSEEEIARLNEIVQAPRAVAQRTRSGQVTQIEGQRTIDDHFRENGTDG